MLVTLYTSRVVLRTLGVEDFGIFNVVGGIVVMFSFLNSAMSSATQRFLSFELGKDNLKQFSKVFSMSINIHVLIALLIFVLAETVGLWFVNTHLVIPPDRMVAANWVYQCSIFSFMVTVVSVPYNASIIAYERMSAFAYISILEVTLKLLIVFILQWLLFDKLKLYAVLLLTVAIVIRIVYGVYCKTKLDGCHYKWNKDRVLFKTLFSYAGWNLWGNLASVGMSQGVNILLNVFFGPAVNAARGIAYQVSAAVNMFCVNFQTAVNPQIIKYYASNNIKLMHKLIFQSAKYSYFLLLLLALPILFQTEFIFQLWLINVPLYAVTYTKIVIIIVLIDSISGPLMTGAQASGKIKLYQSLVGGLLLMILPISYYILLSYKNPTVPLLVNLGVSFVALMARLIILKYKIYLQLLEFVKKVILPILKVTCLAIITPYLLNRMLEDGFLKFTIICILTTMSTIFLISIFGLSKNDRNYIINILKNKLKT